MCQHQLEMKEDRERQGEDVECIRETVDFIMKFSWQYQSNHEPCGAVYHAREIPP
jgi:hypothetical protein